MTGAATTSGSPPLAGRPRGRRGPIQLTALLVPADPTRSVTLLRLADTAAAFSAALGEVLFDAITTDHCGQRYAIHVRDDSGDPAAARPDNPRAAVLAARLGLHKRAVQARLRGDVLVTGLLPDRDVDQDVPAALVTLVTRHIGPVDVAARRR